MNTVEMTLDFAIERFEYEPTAANKAQAIAVAKEYCDDGIIADGTFEAIRARLDAKLPE